MRLLPRSLIVTATATLAVTAPTLSAFAGSPALAAKASDTAAPDWFVQAGTGLLEIGTLQAGLWLTPHLSVEGQASWLGVFGSKLGLGATYAVGHVTDGRPPRHALLLGMRLMTGTDLQLSSGGDSLGAYGVASVGYGFLSGHGFMARITAGPVCSFEDSGSADQARFTVGGPFILGTLGMAF